MDTDQRHPPGIGGPGHPVLGLHLGYIDTDMMAGWDIPKNDPADVVRAGLDGLEDERLEVLADAAAAQAKASLATDPRDRYAQAMAMARSS